MTYDVTDPNLVIAFRRLDRHHALLLTFTFLDDV